MSSLALITAEMHKIGGRYQEVSNEVANLDEEAKAGVSASVTLTVLSCEGAEGKSVDSAAISVSVTVNSDGTETKKDGKVDEALAFKISTMEEVLSITCYNEKRGAEPIEEAEGVTEQASVISVPFTAEFAVKEASKETAMTTKLEGKCDESSESMNINVKITLDTTEDLIASKKRELQELEASIIELQKALKAENAAQTESAKKEKKKPAAAGSSSPKKAAAAGGTVSKPKVSLGQRVSQLSQWAVGVAYNSGSYFIFAGAVSAIYLYGDYASI
jgi:hypothetical protein